jgi:hypothetical protein
MLRGDLIAGDRVEETFAGRAKKIEALPADIKWGLCFWFDGPLDHSFLFASGGLSEFQHSGKLNFSSGRTRGRRSFCFLRGRLHACAYF